MSEALKHPGGRPSKYEAVSRGKALRLRDWETVGLEMRRNGGGPGGATITVFGLKNMGGDEWSDTSKHELTGKDGSPLPAASPVTIFALPDNGRG